MTPENTRPTTAVLIVAAGKGSRAGPDGPPKQYRSIGGQPMLSYCLETFLNHPAIDRVVTVIGEDDATHYRSVAPQRTRLLPPVIGADSRQGSVLAGLLALAPNPPDRILIHDGARPFVSPALTDRVIAGFEKADAIVPTLPVNSTLKSMGSDDRVTATIPRDGIHTAETPQGFKFDSILSAHRKACMVEQEFTDDAAIAEWAGIAVRSVAGEAGNMKITSAADIEAADRRLIGETMSRLGDLRVGVGYDVHTFGPGHFVTLGGVAVPHDFGLVGHSDADVALHALTDAILGALADGDIGAHFPPSDRKWRGASSDLFLADAVRRIARRGGMIGNLDLSIIAEAPKIGPHRDAMRRRIAEICDIDLDRVGVKATTSEGLGFVGRREGIAAYATATIRLPFGKLP